MTRVMLEYAKFYNGTTVKWYIEIEEGGWLSLEKARRQGLVRLLKKEDANAFKWVAIYEVPEGARLKRMRFNRYTCKVYEETYFDADNLKISDVEVEQR